MNGLIAVVVEKMASPKVSFIWTFHLYNYARAIPTPVHRYSMNTKTCTGGTGICDDLGRLK